MSTRLVIDDQNELIEVDAKKLPSVNGPTRWIATIVSYLFHPVFIPVYVMLYLLYIHPFMFLGDSVGEKRRTLAQAVINYTIFPIVTVLLVRATGFITSLQLPTQKDRMIPLMATMIWYFWIWNVWRNLPTTPQPLIVFSLAAFIGTIVGWLMNIYFKVSLHAISVGVLVAFMFYLAFSDMINSGIYISVALVIAGLVCTARMLVSSHRPAEIYFGFAGGILSTLLATLFG